jgi:hypothetical protein
VRNVDIAPTVLELEGLEPNPRMSGVSLTGLARGKGEADARVVVSEGRGTRAIYSGNLRLVLREGPGQSFTVGDKQMLVTEELYDLDTDPGERVNLAHTEPDKVAEMKARLKAALANVPVAGTRAATQAPTPAQPPPNAPAPSVDAAQPPTTPSIALRFAGRGEVRRVRGTITIGDAVTKASDVRVVPVGLGPDAYRVEAGRVEISLATAKDAVVGLDLRIEPPGAPVRWELFLDDEPWPDDLVFGGPFGLLAPSLRHGIATDDAREAAYAPLVPEIDPLRDAGLFVVRERRAEASAGRDENGEGAREMDRVLREWGYAHGSGSGK